jgi:hypothetical protein
MKAIIFLSTDDLVEHLMELYRDIDEDQEYYRGIYSLSLEKIKEYHTDYPYLVKTKKFGCYII